MKVVIRLGGSVIGSPPNPKLIQKYTEIVQNLKAQGHEVVVIVGGGSHAREFIQLAKNLGLNEREQDEVAISVSRLFAQLLSMKLGGLDWKTTPMALEEVAQVLHERGVAVMGGLRPGMTTDAVAALVASEIDARLIVKATDQDGIYTKDPRRYPEAEKLDELSWDDLGRLFGEAKHKAGIHQIIDPEAIRVLREKHIETIVVNGFKPENITAAIRGEKIGTKIH
jgi:uridylate kinase